MKSQMMVTILMMCLSLAVSITLLGLSVSTFTRVRLLESRTADDSKIQKDILEGVNTLLGNTTLVSSKNETENSKEREEKNEE